MTAAATVTDPDHPSNGKFAGIPGLDSLSAYPGRAVEGVFECRPKGPRYRRIPAITSDGLLQPSREIQGKACGECQFRFPRRGFRSTTRENSGEAWKNTRLYVLRLHNAVTRPIPKSAMDSFLITILYTTVPKRRILEGDFLVAIPRPFTVNARPRLPLGWGITSSFPGYGLYEYGEFSIPRDVSGGQWWPVPCQRSDDPSRQWPGGISGWQRPFDRPPEH